MHDLMHATYRPADSAIMAPGLASRSAINASPTASGLSSSRLDAFFLFLRWSPGMEPRGARPAAALVLLVAFGSSPAPAAADPASTASVPLFSIAKSENKNQVQYAVRVDANCAPAGTAPVYAYWRMLEQGPTPTAPLLSREFDAYGLASQVILARGAGGGQARAVLKALPSRPVTIETLRGADGACRALSTVPISGAPAHLFNVYVRLKWDGVDYLLLQGWSMDGSHVVREKLQR
jgi:hypothetical protein